MLSKKKIHLRFNKSIVLLFLINTQKLEDYRKHKLKKSDTIESVAQELGITILELTGFI